MKNALEGLNRFELAKERISKHKDTLRLFGLRNKKK